MSPILNLGTRWLTVVSFEPRLLYHEVQHPLKRALEGDGRVIMDSVQEKKKSLSSAGNGNR
jgi:hypothetical protein